MVFLVPYVGSERARDYVRYKRRQLEKQQAAEEAKKLPPPPPPPEKKRVVIPDSALPLRRMLLEVCIDMDVDPAEVCGIGRETKLVQARREFVYRAKSQTEASLSQIGRAISKDHTTVLYAWKCALKERGEDDRD